MHLLDIAPIPDSFMEYQRWLQSHSQSTPPLPDSMATTPDSGKTVNDTVEAVQSFVGHVGSSGDDLSSLFWAILLVGAALTLCLLFMRCYRRSLA